VGRGVVLGEQSSRTVPALVEFHRTEYVLRRRMDRSRSRPTVRAEMPHSSRGRAEPFATRMDDNACGNSLTAETYRIRLENVSVIAWHSSQRISQFDGTPLVEELIWCASHDPTPVPLPWFLYDSRLLQRFRPRCVVQLLRRHSQYPLARTKKAPSMVSSENSKGASMERVYHVNHSVDHYILGQAE
jgi:hypothetical protein